MAEVVYITCPLCGLNRILVKTGVSAMAKGLTIRKVKGRIRFDHIELETAPIVQIRERERGKEEIRRVRRGGGPGFIFRRGITLTEMKDNPDYSDIVEQIKLTAQNILEILT